MSTFPVAFTRLFDLHYPGLFVKIFNKKTIVPWILAYDAIMIGLQYIDDEIFTFLLSIVLSIVTNFCTYLIFIKIKKMMHQIDDHSKLSTYSDLQRASIVCLIQSNLSSLYIVHNIFTKIFTAYLKSNESSFNTFFVPYIILKPLQYPIYQFLVIFDSFLTLFVLRTYRRVIWNALKIVKKRAFGDKSSTQVVFLK